MRKALFAATALVGLALLPLALRAAQAPAQNPHGELKTDCGECHSAERWTPVARPRFDHAATGFKLEGAHRQARCRSCHESLVFSRVGTACADCHKDAHRGELGPRCEDCHSPRSWSNQREIFQVHNRTRFPLLASHASLDCQACHKGQRQAEYANTPSECFGCHAGTYAGTTSPNHAQARFSTRCEQCHGLAPRGWHSLVGFVHPASFPLVGQHAGLPCSSCHTSGFGNGSTSRECAACHEQDYQRATNPNHAAGRFPRQCDQCHTGTSWRPAKFDHSVTRFQLSGGHAGVACDRCHPGQRYTGTSMECVSCHQANYNQTTNPNHVAGRFATTCQSCHSTNAWRPANFDHDNTRFRLTGAHGNVACERCHQGGRYTGTPTQCYSCHQANYQQASNPSHSGFPTSCDSCHGTNAWRPASFDHSRTRFPLAGAHGRLECGRCHSNGQYSGTPTDCYACHRSDYNGTTNPNHQAAGFPTRCTDCHTTSAWRPATFDHDGRYFPIYSGKHRGKWSGCGDCHVSAGNYRVFECVNCHEHNRTDMDRKHRGVSGYQYNSSSCYRCHPRGQGGD